MKSAPLRCDTRNRVLIVEDNRVSAMVLTRHFAAAGFKESVVDVAMSGADAVKEVSTDVLLFPPQVSLFFSLEKTGPNSAWRVPLDRNGRLSARRDGWT
jgi:hypothetical protein